MTAIPAAETRFLGDSSALDNTIPILDMISPENFEREREKIFRRAWLPVAHVRDFAERGSYKVVEIPTFDTSLIVVRGNDGLVCSFHNICRHRGNKLVRAGEGCRASFVCGAAALPARARVRCCAQRATGAVSPGLITKSNAERRG